MSPAVRSDGPIDGPLHLLPRHLLPRHLLPRTS